MKRKFLLLGVLLVFLFGSLAVYGQDAVYLSTAKEKKYKDTLPELTIKNFKESGVRIIYKYKGTVLAPTYADGDNFYIPHIYGYAHIRDVGSPMLPAKNHHIAVPAGAAVGIEIEDIQFEEHAVDRMVQPAQEPLPDCRNCPDPMFEINRDVYETNADFPANVVEILGCDTYMGVPIAVVQVRPVQFNPVTKTMKVYSKIKFKVTFSGEGCSFRPYGHKNSKHANDIVRSAVLNRDSIPGGLDSSTSLDQARASDAKDYIMIVHSDYLAAAEALAAWKRQMGYSVEIVSQSSWTTTQVDDALKTRYNSWTPKPSFFLLFGDQADVPAEYTSRYTDLYYAEMEGTGYKPEMAYGRIFASSAAEAQVMVDKIINYEKNPPTLSGFYSNTLACAYYQDSDLNSYADRRFTHTSEDIRNHMMGQGYGVDRVYVTGSSVDPLYYNNGNYSPANTPIPEELKRPTFPWDGDAADIINYIDAGRFLVWHRDHGDVALWGDPYFTTSHIDQLNNGDLLPIIMSVNCLTGQFTGSTECFCERFLRRDNGGCVGIFGATNVSYSGPNDGYAPGIIDAIWPDPQIDPQYGSGGLGNPIPAHDPIYTMGDILNHSKVAMEYLWGLHQTTWELHHYFGDPAMQIRTAQPTTATATHPSALNAGETSLAITASNCPDGTATLVYEGILYGKTTLAGDGTGTITFSPLSGVEPNSVLTISNHNFKPYVADVPVTGGLPPDANFVADKTTLMATDSVQFTDSSTMSPSSWEWTFAGGTPGTSTDQNPLVTYNTAGTYTVTLTAANINGSDTETKVNYITVTTLLPPVANFVASSTNISAGDSVDFTDQSTNVPTSWSWTFAGGTPGTGTDQNPTVTYSTPGTYTVTLVAGNAAGSDTETKVDYISVAEKPYCPSQGNTFSMEWVAGVEVGTMNNASGAAGYTDFTSITCYLTGGDTVNVTLTPGFSGSTYTEYWKIWIDYNNDHDFEDAGEEVFSGYGSSVVTGSFTVASGITEVTRMRVSMKYAGYPTPCETFTYGEVEDYTADISEGGCPPPVADFTASATTIYEGDSVTFTDLSTNGPNTLDWTFEGGIPATSTQQNPTVTYNTAGTYDVTLTATNACGTDTETKVNYITVQVPVYPPTADFTFTTTDLTAYFTDTSTDPDGTIVAWDWDFGDGNTSTQQNPIHTYAADGTYTVTLTVTDNDSLTDSTNKPVTVSGPVVEIYVYDITQTPTTTGRNYKSNATITIWDTNNNPVANATVYITWSGVVSGSASGVTAADGTVTFVSDKLKSTGPFTITVDNVTHATHTYNSTLNIETSDTATF
jgi:PKD repeat protein